MALTGVEELEGMIPAALSEAIRDISLPAVTGVSFIGGRGGKEAWPREI